MEIYRSRTRLVLLVLITSVFLIAFQQSNEEFVTVYLIGDSTVANYADNYDEGKDYYQTRYPVTGWGQVFQQFFTKSNLSRLDGLISADSVKVDDRARGGRSTRTFFQEGRWRKVYESLKPGDLVLMQFGHNDAAENKPERYVNIEGYKEFLRLYVHQTRQKGAVPIILTPVNRNYPWEGGKLKSSHGEYPLAAKEVASEMDVYLIDLTQLSMDFFTEKGQGYVSENYFMNLPAGVYEAYPDGQSDNTHFQPEGAREIARLVFEAMTSLKKMP